MNIKNSKVSFLVVTYNAEEYIEKTLRSCLNQTYPDFEILVLDNASNDRTTKIINNINDARITLFEGKNNIGPYVGLNFLLDKAEGEYIAIQDHDDIWFPEKIEKQVDFMKKNPDFIACGTNNYNFYEKNGLLILNKKPFASTNENYVPHSSLLFRNKGFRYDTTKTLADEYFEKIALINSGKIYLIKDALTVHRIRKDGGNLSARRFKLSIKNIKDFFEINKFNRKSFIYLASLFLLRLINEKVRYFLEINIFKRNCEKFTLSDFRNKFEKIII